jgi:hypothetical protein
MKLEDINKKNIYSVPDKYFDQLPNRIQSRVNEEKPVSWLSLNWSLSYKLALPVAAVLLMVFYFGNFNNQSKVDAGALLAEVSTEDIIAYLDYTDITTDEIVEVIDINEIELELYKDSPMIEEFDEIGEEEMNFLYEEYGLDEEFL